MKLRQAKKLLMRPWNKVPKYWMEIIIKERTLDGVLFPYRDHRLEKANVVLGRYFRRFDKKCKQQ